MLGTSEALNYTLASQLECVLVGRANMLQNEIDHAPFCFGLATPVVHPGSLQEILRVRRFLGEGFGFRSDVIPVDHSTSQHLGPAWCRASRYLTAAALT